MKITIALSFLAALCTIEAVPTSTSLENLRIRVRNTKWNVQTTIRDLELLRIHAEDDTLRQVSEKWNEEQDNHRTYKTILISGIRNEVNDAKAAGKDTRSLDSCYDKAVDGIKKSEKAAYDDAIKCVDDARDSIHKSLSFVDNLVSTGETLLTDLDNVFLECHNTDRYRMESCINGELAKTEASLRSLEQDRTTAETTIAPVSKNFVTRTSNCVKQAYSVTYTTGSSIKMGLTLCIGTSRAVATATEKPSP
ncbi:uncharacterized protein LOC112466428 [Temnothorax curvispinosus]|uniref:Uncharacterized protein LOC112466428 n=1 Tax=Temnothorax curvispinosus TaxID=300111 RepID=A0A6J1RBK4_9HYME|nr:uncharacterized protein LOC112466428 [Temnothorax curvispinosus]